MRSITISTMDLKFLIILSKNILVVKIILKATHEGTNWF